MIRCRKSLEILASVAAAMNGQLEIAVRGLPSPTVFPDFAEEISRMPHVTYYGPYAGLPALADAYNKVHFAWAIDYYEAEQNSAWLLPNRLYESLYFGAIPLAQRDVEIGRWLTERRAGVLFDGEMRAAVHTFFSELTPELYASLCDSADAVPVADIAFSGADCKNFVENLASQ
jgi:succinoglycan biosynthesis protein ExoL